jgi:carbamoyltransferase
MSKLIWGISANSHDAAISVFYGEKLVYAGHSERYSKVKNDGDLNLSQIDKLLLKYGSPEQVIWYENPFTKSLRQLYAGQGWQFGENNVRNYLEDYYITPDEISYTGHHESHAAAGFYTSKFDQACVVVIDAIGEFDTLTIWEAYGKTLKKKYTLRYPDSLGLWYSAMTQRCGLKPNEEEYILMGMSALGDPNVLYDAILNDFVQVSGTTFKFKTNLHRGCKQWRSELTSEEDIHNIAAATQKVYEYLFNLTLQHAKTLVKSNNLVLMGGCALNCVANVDAFKYFENVWIMPNPGDAGSSIGAVLAKHRKHIEWTNPYLGYDLGYYATNQEIVDHLLEHNVAAVARGPAEFGPRALGNRSLLADPRLLDIKDRVNKIKHREPFRPFAPAILAEHADSIFEMPCSLTPYMQYAVKCKQPNLYPGIVHVDGTSRVQTVTKEDNPQFRALLELWYETTGCPMLVNTSLNIKGQPIINDQADIKDWEAKYKVKIFN